MKKKEQTQTRNNLKKHIKELTFDELHFELNDVNKSLMKCKNLVLKKNNPYALNLNPKMLKYKKCLIINRISEMTRFGGK